MAHVQGHYKAVAKEYDSFFEYMYDEKADITCRWLNLLPSDSLVEIGGGTGAISSLIHQKAGLKQPVLVVDPSPDMLQIAMKREGVLTLEASFDNFITMHPETVTKYNKFAFIGCVHLFPHLEASLRSFGRLLKPGDQLLIVERRLYIVEDTAFELKTSTGSLDQLEFYLKEAGFSVGKKGEESYAHTISKENYFYALRHRSYTALSLCTDEEIEAGIDKLDQEVLREIYSRN